MTMTERITARPACALARFRRLFAPLLLSACGPSRSPPSTTPVVASAPPPALSPRAPAAAPPASAWIVRPRFRLDAGPDIVEETFCVPGVRDVLPLADGSAWVFGACGLRLRLAGDGTFTDHRADWQPLFLGFNLSPVCCAALPTFEAATPRPPDDVFIATHATCGMDPSALVSRPVERFGGASWSPEGGPFYEEPHDGTIDALAWGGSTLYGLARGNDVAGFKCSVGRLDGKQWKPLRRCEQKTGAVERFTALAVDPEGRPSIAGKRETPGGWAGFVAVFDGKKWTEERTDLSEPSLLSIAADGTLWVSDDASVSRRTAAGSFENVPLPPGFIVASLSAKSRAEAWMGGSGELLHIDAAGSERIPVAKQTEQGSPGMVVKAMAGQVWAHDGFSVWDVSRSAPAVPPVLQKPRGVTAREVEFLEANRVHNARACAALKAKMPR